MCLDVTLPGGYLAYVILLVTSTAEATPIIGAFVPGQLVLVTSSALARTGVLAAFPVLAVSLTGAIVGDALGYYAGLRWGRTILATHGHRFGIRHEHVTASELIFEKYGALAIILFRFSFVLRAVGPLFAGIGRMRPRTFWTMNVIGGVIWTGLYFALGFVLGDAYCRFSAAVAPFGIAAGLILGGVVAYLLWRRTRVFRSA